MNSDHNITLQINQLTIKVQYQFIMNEKIVDVQQEIRQQEQQSELIRNRNLGRQREGLTGSSHVQDEADSKQRINYYSNMKQDLQQARGSILDYLIQQNVIQAFRCEKLGQSEYTEKQYTQFLMNLKEIAGKFDVLSYELKCEMEQIPKKGEYFQKILLIRSKIHAIYLPELTKMLKKSREMKGLVKDQDIIALLGPSGAGKSTIMQLLLGYKLRKGRSTDGLDTLMPTAELSQEHRDFIAKPSSKSVTKFVSAVAIDTQKYCSSASSLLVDTPGFFDTGGDLVEACNSLSTIEVLQQARSIRFCFVFNYKSWGKRAGAFKQFIKVVSSMFADYQASASHIVYILNEFSTGEIEAFNARVQEFKKNGLNQSEKADTRMLNVVDHLLSLLQKAERKARTQKCSLLAAFESVDQIIIMDPLNVNLEMVYEKIFCDERKLFHPSTQLCLALSEKVRQALQLQATQLECIANQCRKNEETSAFNFYIGNLRDIAEMTASINDCANAKQKVDKISEMLRTQLERNLLKFNRKLSEAITFNLDKQVFSGLSEDKKNLHRFIVNYKDILCQKAQRLQQIIEQSSACLIDKLREEKTHTTEWLASALQFFDKVNPNQTQKFRLQMNEKLDQLVKNLSHQIHNAQFENFDADFNQIMCIRQMVGDMEESCNPNLLKQAAKSKIKSKYQLIEKSIANVLELDEKNIEQVNKNLRLLSVPSRELPELEISLNNIRLQLSQHFQQFYKQFQKIYKSGRDSGLAARKKLELICKIELISKEASKQFEFAINLIRKQLIEERSNLDQLLKKMLLDPIEAKYVYKQIIKLEKLSELCEFEERLNNQEAIRVAKKKLLQKLSMHCQKIKFMSYTLQTYRQQTNDIVLFYQVCMCLTCEYEQTNQILDMCNEIVQQTRDKLKAIISEITLEYSRYLNIENNPQVIDESMIGRYCRIKRFFNLIKIFVFLPPDLKYKIQKAKEGFEKCVQGNFKTFEQMKQRAFQQIRLKEKNENKIEVENEKEIRKNVEKIIKLQRISRQARKLPDLKELLTHSFEHKDEPGHMLYDLTEIKISSLQKQIKDQFDQFLKKQAYYDCYLLVSRCKALEGLDVLNLGSKFQQLISKLTGMMAQCKKSHDASFETFKKLPRIQILSPFKRTYEYLSKFGVETPQRRQLNQMLEQLKVKIGKSEADLLTEVKRLHKNSKWFEAIKDEQIEEIKQKISHHFNLLKQAQEMTNIKFNPSKSTLADIGLVCFKIISNYETKVQKFLRQENISVAECFVLVISLIEELIEENKLLSPEYDANIKQKKMKIHEFYLKRIAQKKEKIEKKYFNKEIQISFGFTDQIGSFSEKQQAEIKKKIIQQYRNLIRDIELNFKNQQKQKEQLKKLTRQEKFFNLTGDIQNSVNDLLEQKLKTIEASIENMKREANKKFQFGKLFDLFQNQDRLYLLTFFEKMAEQKIDNAITQLKNPCISADQFINILKENFISPFKGKDVTSNHRFMAIFTNLCAKGASAIQQHFMEKKISTMKKVLIYHEKMEGKQKGILARIPVVLNQIKRMLLFLYQEQENLKAFDFSQVFEEVKKILVIFIRETDKINEAPLEQIIREPSKFNAWLYQCQSFEACFKELEEEKLKPLEELLVSFKKTHEKGEMKQKELHYHLHYLQNDLQKVQIFSPAWQVISRGQKLRRIGEIAEKIKAVKCIERLGERGIEFFNANPTMIVKKAMSKLQAALERQLLENCKKIEQAFAQLKVQFGGQINILLSCIIGKLTELVAVDKTIQTEFIDAIENGYKCLRNKMEDKLKKHKQFDNQVGSFCQLLVLFFKASVEVNYDQDRFEKILTDILEQLGPRLDLVLKQLKGRNDHYSQSLLIKYDCFRHNKDLSKTPNKIVRTFINQVSRCGNAMNEDRRNELYNFYECCQMQFKSWVKKYYSIPTEETVHQLLESIKALSKASTSYYRKELREDQYKSYKLVGQILALWTILSYHKEETMNHNYSTQIITIILCLSLLKEDSPRDLNSMIAQVQEREGKSLTIAVIATYLALSGFEVSCLCYSDFLGRQSSRKFKKLFQKLQVSHLIKYGQLNTIFQLVLNGAHSQQNKFRQKIQKIFQFQVSLPEGFIKKVVEFFRWIFSSSRNKTGIRRIILIDEIESIFNPQYFGELYRPKASLTSPEIKQLIKYVWKKYKQSCQIMEKDIKQSQEFRKAIEKHSKLSSLISEQVMGMIQGCRNSKHDYCTDGDAIQYRNQEGVPLDLQYDYSTEFAYLRESDCGKILSVQNQLVMKFVIAQFSYALLPKLFHRTISVTGSYQDLATHQKNYLKDEFKIDRVYLIPSAFQRNPKQVLNQPKIVTEQGAYLKQLTQYIVERISEKPVLVFFEHQSQLLELYQSDHYLKLQKSTQILTPRFSPHEADLIISKSVKKQQITLLTKHFGRGTDFPVVSKSEQVQNGCETGSLHVIQTFLSLDSAQQLQIQSTASPPTYHLLINKSELAKLGITSMNTNFLDSLRKAREQKQLQQEEDWGKLLGKLKGKHEECEKVYLGGETKELAVVDYIRKINKFGELRSKVCKTCILIDGTIPSSDLLSRLYVSLPEIMDLTSEIVNRHPNARQSHIQLAVYRNYGCRASGVFQTSCFDNRPGNLAKFLKSIWLQQHRQNSSLQIGLHHLNSNKEISQAILVGGATDHPQEILSKRKLIDQSVFREYPLLKPFSVKSAEEELSEIKDRRLRIHSLYFNSHGLYKRIAEQTDGQALDLTTLQPPWTSASDAVSRFLGRCILRGVAQNERDFKMMAAEYQKKLNERNA